MMRLWVLAVLVLLAPCVHVVSMSEREMDQMKSSHAQELVPVRWSCPGRQYHGVVHYVTALLNDDLGGTRVVVW